MEKRLLAAIALMVVVAIVPTLFLKPPHRPVPTAAALADSARAGGQAADTGAAGAAGTSVTPPAPGSVRSVSAPVSASPAATAPLAVPATFDTTVIAQPKMTLGFTTDGGAIDHAVALDYKSFQQHGPADLVRPDDRLLLTRIIVGNDTVRFDSVPFDMTTAFHGVSMAGHRGSIGIAVTYTADPRDYVYHVAGSVDGLEGRGGLMMVGLGTGFTQTEADSNDNYRYYGVSVRRGSPRATDFRSVPSDSSLTLSGPFDWVALKSKYFLAALLSADSTRPEFSGVIMRSPPRASHAIATHVSTWATLPIGPDGRFAYDLYLGPQEARGLHAMGRDLDRASPYGWAIFRPIIMPVASWVARILRWMHESFHMKYGWALVLFGILVRLVLWPLNQKAMKSQVAMMAVQPILKEVQERHKDDPRKQQAEIMRVYKEHNVSYLGGCLPMLLPWPVLIALFFAFSKAIELRGAPFLWLPDLAQRDPYYIIPLIMGLSMFALSKLSQAGMPPNPQTKMMTMVMPVMMTVLFLNFPSGLNLYYAVSNVVSLPQQYFINKARQAEMKKRQPLRS